MKILHLVRGLLGANNGVDIYIRNFIKASVWQNIIVVPKNKNKNSEDIKDLAEIIELEDLHKLKNIVEEKKIDIVLIHFTGEESWQDNDKIFRFQNIPFSSDGTPLNQNLNFNTHSLANASLLWNIETRLNFKLFIISHACYKLPSYLTSNNVDGIIHVSQKAKKVNENLKTKHFVIYPCISEELAEPVETIPSKNLRFGWLGRLEKIDSEAYQTIKEVLGNKEGVEFIFAGEGEIDTNPPSNFYFKGNMDRKEFFANIDIFLYPTSIDSFSIAFLEAIYQNKVCLVSNEVEELYSVANNDNIYTYDNNNSWTNLGNYLDEMVIPRITPRSVFKNRVYSKVKSKYNFSHSSMLYNFHQVFKGEEPTQIQNYFSVF